MATATGRIEKEFYLKALCDEQAPVAFLRDGAEYALRARRIAGNRIVFASDRPLPSLTPGRSIDLLFKHQGKALAFAAKVSEARRNSVVVEAPEFMYKNLGRSHPRVAKPPDLQARFTFWGERYSLSFPKIAPRDSEDAAEFMEKLKPLDPGRLGDPNKLVARIKLWLKDFADGFKLTIFKDMRGASAEEAIIAKTGKAFFLPSTLGSLPSADPCPDKRLVTDDMLKRHLSGSAGVDERYVDAAAARFVRMKREKGVFSEVWVPILFQDYVVGCLHVWSSREDLPPPDYEFLDTLFQFARALSLSLKASGYFDSGRLDNEPFAARVVDISASGLLFSCPFTSLSRALRPDAKLSVKLLAPGRAVDTAARIVRRYIDRTGSYFGCRFLDMEPEDIRFLFEFLYGKPFVEEDACFLAGQM